MLRIFITSAALAAVVSMVAAEELTTPHRPLTGVYRIYGGGLGDPVAPTARDKKIMFSISGKAARELFDAIAPDVKDACVTDPRIRVRKRDKENLYCSKSAEGEYDCNFGFDLVTGKSIGGSVC